MPELPEVETFRQILDRVLVGRKIIGVEIPEDEILLEKRPAELLRDLLLGAKVTATGRKGKIWWLELDRKPWLFGHQGMTGHIREIGAPTIRLLEQGKAPLDDADGRPRFLKMFLESEDKRAVVLTDARRLARLWLSDSPAVDRRIRELSQDCLEEPYSGKDLYALLKDRKAPIKALLLNQSLFAGVGNWVADEALFHSGVAPQRLPFTMKPKEFDRLAEALYSVLKIATEAGADSSKYPVDWLFHVRWGGKRGETEHQGVVIRRDTVGGRTSAWAPSKQK